jgi:hypothetical protein
MSDNFRAQYRRLCKEAEGRHVDLMDDVRGVLHDLGYDVGRPRSTVKIPLHHGAVARKRQLVKTKQSTGGSAVPVLSTDERRRRQAINQFNVSLNAAVREMQTYTVGGVAL